MPKIARGVLGKNVIFSGGSCFTVIGKVRVGSFFLILRIQCIGLLHGVSPAIRQFFLWSLRCFLSHGDRRTLSSTLEMVSLTFQRGTFVKHGIHAPARRDRHLLQRPVIYHHHLGDRPGMAPEESYEKISAASIVCPGILHSESDSIFFHNYLLSFVL